MKLSQGAAINGWMSDYLLQFFKWPVAAAAINALLASLLCLICVLVLKKLKTGNDLLEIGVIPVLMLLLVFPFQLNLLIEGIAFYAGLLGYLYLKQYRWHFVYAILFLPLGFLLISIPLLVLFYVLLMVFDYMFTKKTVFLPVYLLCIVTTLCLVKIVSNQIGYIPFETRYFYTKSVSGNDVTFNGAVRDFSIGRDKFKNGHDLIPDYRFLKFTDFAGDVVVSLCDKLQNFLTIGGYVP